MSRKAEPHDSLPQLSATTDRLGESFAKALAVFLKEAVPLDTKEKQEALRLRLHASPELNRLGQAHSDALDKEHAELSRQGKLEEIDFDDLPRPTLQQLVRARGLSQKQLAKRVGMDPAALSRVLKDPEKSRVVTVKRIAKALNVSIADIV